AMGRHRRPPRARLIPARARGDGHGPSLPGVPVERGHAPLLLTVTGTARHYRGTGMRWAGSASRPRRRYTHSSGRVTNGGTAASTASKVAHQGQRRRTAATTATTA